MKPTKLYHINRKFAQHESLPVYFVARELLSTNKAIYLYGRGTTQTKKMGVCMNCGRKLTHPVSVELGIGPECGKHYWDWDAVGGYTKDNIRRLTKAVQEKIKIDTWIPKSVVKEVRKTSAKVTPPKDHEMLNKKSGPTEKKAVPMAGDKIKILFPFDKQTVRQVKTIPGRKYVGDEDVKYWHAPISVEAVEKLQEFGFKIHKKLLDYYSKSKVDTSDLKDVQVDIPGLGGDLYSFQEEGVAFLEARDGRALIGDEMGLGKTVQALAYLQNNPDKRPAIIVCPSSLKINWMREAQHWMSDPDIQILSGTDASGPIHGDVLIINYHILKDWKERLKDLQAEVLVLDEFHYIKNNKAKRTKAAKFIGKHIPHVIGLSGTPILNRPVELINPVRLVDKSVIPNAWHFKKRYCDAQHNGFGWDFSGASNTEELHEKLTNTVMIRRKKKEVLTQLPDKVRSFVPVELNNKKEYQQAEDDFVNYVKEKTEQEMEMEIREKLGDELFGNVEINQQRLEQLKKEKAEKVSNAEALVKIEGLKQLAVKGKLDQAVSWIRDFLNSDGKLVVMATHKFTIKKLMEEFGDIAVKVDGSVSGADRDKAVQQFQNNDKIKLFIGNMKAAGVGLTLTAASAMAFLELPWTPGDLSQAMDRIHRIGQEEVCNYYFLLAENTIEEKIANMLDKKTKTLDSVLDGKKPAEQSLLSELMTDYKQF